MKPCRNASVRAAPADAHVDRGADRSLPVFRRDAVFTVFMVVRLRPAVRCTYDEDQGILRITLKEAVEEPQPGGPTSEIVVYALKVRLNPSNLGHALTNLEGHGVPGDVRPICVRHP